MSLANINLKLATILLGVITMFFLAIAYFASPPRIGKVVDTFEVNNGFFKIRVAAHEETGGGFVPGAYYVFESAPMASSNWRQIMVFRHDDRVEIPRDHVRFLSDRIGYVFMGLK